MRAAGLHRRGGADTLRAGVDIRRVEAGIRRVDIHTEALTMEVIRMAGITTDPMAITVEVCL